MIACFYFWYRFISAVLLWIFNFSGQTCVSLHCRSLSESLRRIFPLYAFFLTCQARLGSSLVEAIALFTVSEHNIECFGVATEGRGCIAKERTFFPGFIYF